MYKVERLMPRQRQRALNLFILLVLCLIGSLVVNAQEREGNLLKNGGFDGSTYKNVVTADDGTSFNVPVEWNGWYTTSPHTEAWMNLIPNGYPHTASMKMAGSGALNISRGSATFTIAVYQRVDGLSEGTKLLGVAYALQDSDSSSDAHVRIGIDPAGETNPLSSNIIWSGWYTSIDQWIEMQIEATTTGNAATLFIYATQNWATIGNDLYLDDARLVKGGGGGETTGSDNDVELVKPAPTTPPSVPFVSAQGPQKDGSIVHKVQSGDTIDSIAVAYGITRDELLELNNLDRGAFLQIGQKLLVKPADEDSNDNEDSSEDSNAETAENTNDTEDTGNSNDTSDSEADNASDAEVEVEMTPEVTAEPRLSPEDAPPAPVVAAALSSADPAAITSSVCVLLYDDVNANRIQENEEMLLPGATIMLNLDGESIGTYETDGASEPYCFADLTAGNYVASASAPTGYGLTTPDQLRLHVAPGTKLNVAFGAAAGITPLVPPPADSTGMVEEIATTNTGETSPTDQLMQISGLIVFGLAGFALVGGLSMTLLLRRQ